MSSLSYCLSSYYDKTSMWNPLSLIFNEKRTFSFQLLFSLYVIILSSMLLTLVICFGLTIFPSNDAYRNSMNSANSQLSQSMAITALQITNAITHHINTISDSINLKSVLFASILLQNGTNIQGSNMSAIFTNGKNYYDYNFVDGCQYPTCPQDFQPLTTYTKRIGTLSGSMSTSSISLYYSQLATTISSSSSLSTLLSRYPTVGAVTAALQIQDNDYKVSYDFGPDFTQFISLTAKLTTKNSSFVSIHKTYPGIKQPVGYNPTNMSWFLKAPEGKLHFDTPFVNKMTSQVSFRLSTKKTVHAPKGIKLSLPMTIVGATMVSMDILSQIILNMTMNTNYQAMLVNAGTSEVLWFGNTTVINPSTQTLKTIFDMDLNLGITLQQMNGFGTFSYLSSISGLYTVGLSQPFFLHWSASSKGGSAGDTSEMAFVLLLLRPNSLYRITNVNELSSTTNTQIILIAVLIVTIFTLLLVLRAEVFVDWFTEPLSRVIHIATTFVDIAAVQGNEKSFHELSSDDSWVDKSRGDEAGDLAIHFMNMLQKMHLDNEAKKKKAKYPINPFHIKGGGVSTFNELSVNLTELHPPSRKPSSNISTIRRNSGPMAFFETHTPLISRLMSQHNSMVVPDTTATLEESLPLSLSKSSDGKKTCFNLNSTKLRNYWFILALSMVSVMAALVLFAFFTVNSVGNHWGDALTEQKRSVLQDEIIVLAASQSIMMNALLWKSKLALLTQASFIQNLEIGNTTYSNYLTSYSMDKTSGYASRTNLSYSYSGYFEWDVAGCRSNVSCASVQNSLEVKRTSLLDLQFRSYMYDGRVSDSFQYGVQSSGFVRSFPYTRSYSSNPQSCLIEDSVTLNICKGKYTNSKCSDSTSSGFPAYDPRCSMWYTAAYSGDENSVFTQNVINTTNGVLVIPSSTPVLSAPLAAGGHLIGVLSGQFLVQDLITMFKSVISTQDGIGYSFVIDVSSGTKDIVLFHPNLVVSRAYTPTRLSAIESCFSPTEYQTFLTNVVNKINANSAPSSLTFVKCRSSWLLTYSVVSIGSRVFAVMATVPLSRISVDGDNIVKDLKTSIITYITAFAICDCFLFLCMMILAYTVISAVLEPLVILKSICEKIVIGDYDFDPPKSPFSLDMKRLLESFGNMLVTLQFDYENFARGHHDIAMREFSASLKLYTMFGNKRRIGIAQNNLGVVEIFFGDFRSAEMLFHEAIANAHEMIENADNWEGIGNAQRILSNRQGNLAMAYMEQDRLTEAENLLRKSMIEDQNQSFIFGYISKLCNLSQLFIRQKKYPLALEVLIDAMEFATSKQTAGLFDEHWTAEDAIITEQNTLRNFAMLYEEMGKKTDAEETYLKALTFCDIMNARCTNKILASLNTLLTEGNRKDDLLYLNNLAKQYNFRLTESESTTTAPLPRRIGFVIHNTGAIEKKWMEEVMKGAKDIVRNLNPNDLVTVQHADPLRTKTDFPLREKARNLGKLNATFDQLVKPVLHGSQFTPVLGLLNSFGQNSSQFESTVILITDSSTIGPNEDRFRVIAEALSRTAVSLVVLAVGSGIARDDLETLVLHARKGHFIYSYCTTGNISEAFEEVSYWVKRELYFPKGQVLLEEF